MGRAARDRHHKVPILGVVPVGTVTYPEDDRPGAAMRVSLEPNHTHLVGLASNDFYDSTIYRFMLTKVGRCR